jgi:truncated hemoglobin YjbI
VSIGYIQTNMNPSQTIVRLSEITDQGAFERLATAILREANPDYASLVHPGVNAQGKTVKAPLDGIAFVAGMNPPHMIAVHHTTCARDNLETKWLHGSAAVKARKGSRPTAPPGDLLKTASIVAEERLRTPALRATLVLTTNQEPSQDVVRNVHDAGRKYDIVIDLWPRSRLAHFLDKPEGQWIRQSLGIEQEQLSRELLKKLSKDSAEINRPADDRPEAWVDRGLDRAIEDSTHRGVVFVVAESGLGKSVACYKQLVKHIAGGGCGLVLPHEVIASALTLDQAIDLALHQLHPCLTPGVGLDAQLLCSPESPFLLVAEDINRSGQAAQLAEKLANWSHRDRNRDQGSAQTWWLLCPLWPRAVASLQDQARKRIEALTLSGVPLTQAEARNAVQRRAELRGLSLSAMDADAIADMLGNDPLLIALHDQNRTPNVLRVLDEFIESSMMRTASHHPEFTVPDYSASLQSLARELLARRRLDPAWSEIIGWYGPSSETVAMLRRLVEEHEIIRLVGPPTEQRLGFRHDRVRDSLLSTAVAALIRTNAIDPNVLADPYFAEIIGGTLTQDAVPPEFVTRVASANPLALFHALRLFKEPTTDVHRELLKALHGWLDQPATHDDAHRYLRRHALAALAETESSRVLELVRRFKDQGWSAWQARFRNGDVFGGIELCRAIEPGSGAPWRDRQIDHAKMRLGNELIAMLDKILRRADLPVRERSGALRLAGHLANPVLAEAIEASWYGDGQRLHHLADYLWAAAECCGDNPDRFLAQVCDAWAALPKKAEKVDGPRAREDLAAHSVRFAFRKSLPPNSAIGYFIRRAQNEELRWPITFLLHGMDHPDAIEFIARELATIARQLEGTQRFSSFEMTAHHEWSGRLDRFSRRMSSQSRARLLSLWNTPDAEKHLREQAFRLWAATENEGDLAILRQVEPSNPLSDLILFHRLSRGDQQAIPDLLQKLRGDDESYWWQSGRYLWSEQLTEALDQSLTRRGASAPRNWDQKIGTDWMTSEMVMRLPTDTAEALLLKHWDHLRFSSYFVQAALYAATPQLTALVAEVMAACPCPREMMQYIGSGFGIKSNGRVGVTHRAQVEALVPYLDLLGKLELDQFWEVCNDRGWFDLRREHFDSRIADDRTFAYMNEQHVIATLDEFVKARVDWIDPWLDRFLETGATVDYIVGLLYGWLATRNSIEALNLVATTIIHIGGRSHLSVLRVEGIQPVIQAAAIIADATFAVQRNGLQ